MASDPWLTARMEDYAALRRAEEELRPAVQEAVAAFLADASSALLGQAGITAAAEDEQQPPELDRFPEDSAWQRLVERYITPVARRIFRTSYLDLASADTETFASQASRYTQGIAQRVMGFPRRVWDKVRAVVSEGMARRRKPSELRRRVGELLKPQQFTGQVNNITRTEVHTAVCAGAFAAALDEQSRTGQAWTKTWISTRDDRVRDTHRHADGQVRDLDEAFRVGGFALQFPGDPLGPPEEIFNCRCSARYRQLHGSNPAAMEEA